MEVKNLNLELAKVVPYEKVILYVCSICLRSHHQNIASLKKHMILEHKCVVRNRKPKFKLYSDIENKVVKPEILEDSIPVVGFKDFKVLLTKSSVYNKDDHNLLDQSFAFASNYTDTLHEFILETQFSMQHKKQKLFELKYVQGFALEEYLNAYKKSLNDGLNKIPLKRKLLCPQKGCCFKFDTEEKQETHFRCHASEDLDKLKDFKCFDCGLEMKTWRNCSNHMWTDHEIDVDFLSCPICSFKAMTSIKIWRHMKVHKKWKTKVLQSYKRRDLSYKEELLPNTNKYYSEKTCEICTRKFANGKTLSKHIKAVHNKIKPFICNVCGLKLGRKSTLLIHMRQHIDEKIQCKTCDFKARDPSVIYKHEMRHKNLAPYKCKLCNFSSIQTKNYKAHVKYYHPEEYKKIACDQCNFVTITEEKLEAHRKDHNKGLIMNEDSMETSNLFKNPQKYTHEKSLGNVEISSDCFLPLESTDSIQHDDTGGVTIPAHSEDTQFPNF